MAELHELDYALCYARRGWPVFRIKHNSKVPLDKWVTGGPHDAATTDPDEIARRWWPHWWPHSPHNIGIATGRELPTGGFLTVLDLDMDEPEFAGRPDWAKPTREVSTPSGGLHLYYRTAEPISSRRIAPGVDVKSRGGMVVAPPSSINGAQYRIARAARLAVVPVDCFCPTEPLSFDAQLGASKQRQSFAPEERVGKGGRDNYLARYAGWWLNKAESEWADAAAADALALVPEPTEYDLAVELDYHNLMVCQPPLPERDIKRIARSIYAKHLRGDA